MHVRFFGTRGSVATPGPHTLRYGGNTSCVEVRSSSDTLVVLDMGTGATVLGRELMARGEPSRGHSLISHPIGTTFRASHFSRHFSFPALSGTSTGRAASTRACGRLWLARCNRPTFP